jgi:hypothetical protein
MQKKDANFLPVSVFSKRNDYSFTVTETTEEFVNNLKDIVGNLFEHVKWDGIAITGSIIPRCMYNFNDRFKSYYEGSDIDVMVTANTEIDFDYRVQKLYESIKKSEESAELSKVVTPNQHKYYITFDSNTVKTPKLDIFRVKNIPYVVSRFHFAMVRAFYDGNQVWMFPSCISSLSTRETSDIRWVSCKSDLKITLLKYIQRGFKFKLSCENYKKLGAVHGETLRDLKVYKHTFKQDGKKESIKALWNDVLLK